MTKAELRGMRSLIDTTTRKELDYCRSMINMHRTVEDKERFKDQIWSWQMRAKGVQVIRHSLLNRLTRMINGT